MKQLTFALIAAVISFTACVPILHPIYTAKDLVEVPELVGLWKQVNDPKEIWSFIDAGDKSYHVVHVAGGGTTSAYLGHLARIGDNLFLDLYPDMKGFAGDGGYREHFVPAHTILLVSQETSRVKISALNDDWMKSSVKAGGGEIRHEIVGDRVVLTASTEELQTFFRKIPPDSKAFSVFAELTRLR